MMFQPYRFIGGKYDGGMLPVAQPAPVGLELRVRSLDPTEPSEFYVLGEDGCFHLQPPSQAVPRLDLPLDSADRRVSPFN